MLITPFTNGTLVDEDPAEFLERMRMSTIYFFLAVAILLKQGYYYLPLCLASKAVFDAGNSIWACNNPDS